MVNIPISLVKIYLLANLKSSSIPLIGNLQWSPSLMWLVVGSLLCLVEVPVPTAFVALTMGLAAIAVSIFALWFPAQFGFQVFLWMMIATGGVFATRRLLPKRKVSAIQDSSEAETITDILPGKVGRVLYEGNSWPARCEDRELRLEPQQKVFVVRREGNTLIVVPENLLHL